MTSKTRRLAGAVLSLSLVAAACGGDDDDDTTPESPTTESEAPAEETTPVTEAPADETTPPTEAPVEETTPATDAPTSEAPASDEPFTIAFVAPSTVNDLSWTQALYDGLTALEDSYDLEIAYSEGMFDVAAAGETLRGYAEDGYDLIIAHGTQYAGSIQELAPEFPEQTFAYGTATDTFGLPNVFAYTSDSQEAGYVNGTMAATLTGSTPIGVVGPVEAGDAKLYVDGFLAAVEAAGGAANVTYTGSFSDVALATEAANAFVATGVGALTGSSQSMTGAIAVAQSAGLPWFSVQSDQTSLAPDTIVASVVYDLSLTFGSIIDSIQGGTLGGEAFTLNFGNEGFKLVFNDGYALDPAIATLGEETVAGIVSGEIVPTVAG